MSPELERTLVARGASLETVLGQRLPADFGDAAREWRAAREGCAVFAAGFRALIGATGGDRADFLQGMLSNDVKALAAGQGVYAALLNESGKVVSDLRVYAESERLLLDSLASRRAVVVAGLERFLVADDVKLQLLDDEEPLVGLEGPFSAPVLGEVLGTVWTHGEPLSHAGTVFEGRPLCVVAIAEVGGSGFLLCGHPQLAPRLFEACCEAGAVPLGMRALDILRVEAGIPWAGVDMDEQVLVMEVGLDRALSFTKGCYLGQEVVERITARGHVNRKLVGLAIEGSAVPPAASAVEAEGKQVGVVTSAVHSIGLGRPIGLGLLHRQYIAAGQRVDVVGGGAARAALVTTLPFNFGDPESEEE